MSLGDAYAGAPVPRASGKRGNATAGDEEGGIGSTIPERAVGVNKNSDESARTDAGGLPSSTLRNLAGGYEASPTCSNSERERFSGLNESAFEGIRASTVGWAEVEGGCRRRRVENGLASVETGNLDR